jgi:hypothetical protein
MTRIPLHVDYISLSKLFATGTETSDQAKITSLYDSQEVTGLKEQAVVQARAGPKG